MSMLAIIYIAGKCYSIEYGVEWVYGSMVGMGTCGPRVSTSRSGGETTAVELEKDHRYWTWFEKLLVILNDEYQCCKKQQCISTINRTHIILKFILFITNLDTWVMFNIMFVYVKVSPLFAFLSVVVNLQSYNTSKMHLQRLDYVFQLIT